MSEGIDQRRESWEGEETGGERQEEMKNKRTTREDGG